jgi:hypothetical protein
MSPSVEVIPHLADFVDAEDVLAVLGIEFTTKFVDLEDGSRLPSKLEDLKE